MPDDTIVEEQETQLETNVTTPTALTYVYRFLFWVAITLGFICGAVFFMRFI